MNVSVLAHDFEKQAKTAKFKPLFTSIQPERCIPTGCRILNLVLSGRIDGGWLRGRIARVIGDSDTGKTMLCLTTLAEMAHDKRFDGWRKVFDDAEVSNEFDMSQWGQLQDQIEAPGENSSYYIEEFYSNVSKMLQNGTPFAYVLDSADALESQASVALFNKNMKELDAGKNLSASYGDGKAAIHSKHLRKIKADLKTTESVLLIISQTRDNLDAFSFASKTTAGGKALKFYSCYQVWLAKVKNITRIVNGNVQNIGTLVRVRIDKNHATGKHLDFNMPIYYGWGIDDERCSIQWLLEQKVWVKTGRHVNTKGFTEGKVTEKELAVKLRNDAKLRRRFHVLLQTEWDSIESKIRKPGRYSGKGENEEDESVS